MVDEVGKVGEWGGRGGGGGRRGWGWGCGTGWKNVERGWGRYWGEGAVGMLGKELMLWWVGCMCEGGYVLVGKG